MYLGLFFVFIILLSILFVVWVLFLFFGGFFAHELYYSNFFFLQKSYILVLFIHNIKLQMYLNKQSVMLQFQ